MERVDEVRKDKKLGVCFEASGALKKYVFGDTIDELIDGLELLNNGSLVNEFVCEFPDLTEKQLERLDTLMAKATKAVEIVKYAIKRGEKLSNRKEIEKRLVELENISGICMYINMYIKECRGKDNDTFVELICEKESPRIINAISKVDEVDLHKLKKAMFGINYITRDIREIYELINFCSYHQKKSHDIITLNDVKKLEQIVIDSNNASYSRICAENIEGTNIERLQKVVEESEDAEEIFFFALQVKGADIDKLRNAIKKTEDNYYKEVFKRKFGHISTIDKIKRFFK